MKRFNFKKYVKGFSINILILIIIMISNNSVYSQVISRESRRATIVTEKSPLYQNFENYILSINMSDKMIIEFLRDDLDLRRAAGFLEKYGMKISKKINNISNHELAKFVGCSEPILGYLTTLGIKNKNLEKIITLFKKRIYVNGNRKGRLIKVKKVSVLPIKNKLKKENLHFFLDNELFISTDDLDKNEISDLVKVTVVGNNKENNIQYKFSFQNKDNDQNYSFINSLEYEEYIPEAYLSFIYPNSPYKKLDVGRYRDSMFYGNFYSGFSDGIRGMIEKNRWNFMLAIESFEKRYEKNGFENMELSLFDTVRSRAKYIFESGELSLEYLNTNLQASPGNLPNWNNGISTLIYPALTPVTTSGFSTWGISGEKEWSSHILTRGFIEFQDMEDFNNSSKMGRSFEGNQYGFDVEYSDEEEIANDTIYSQVRLREIDHINLGRVDNFYGSEYLNNFGLSKNGFCNPIKESFNNSIYLNLGIDHVENVRFLKNPLHLRAFYETLTGWKDLNNSLGGSQDNVLEQYATGIIAEYRNSSDWVFKARIRNIIYNSDDFEYRQYEAFSIGSAPRDRLEFDLRVSTPLF